VLEEEDVALPALARVLALQALPLLARTRELDAAEGARLHVIAAEQERASGITDARGGTRELRFRVDRIERIDGAERLTDFKTGRPPSTAKAPATRWQHFVRAVARGEALQPFAYALAAGAGGSGRLLFVNPERAPEAAAAGFVARCDDAELASAFEAAVHALLAAWDTGGFLPVLVGPDLDEAPAACRFCDVAQACLQGDTGARRRLAAWLEARSRQGLAGLSEAEQALFALYQLRVKPGAEVESA
jgi:hypothetical protein